MTDLLAFSDDLPVEAVPAGDVLIAEGTRPSRMLVLVAGEVVVERDGVPFARIDTPGAVFGEMSAVLERPATATVRAVGDLRVHVIDDPLGFLTERRVPPSRCCGPRRRAWTGSRTTWSTSSSSSRTPAGTSGWSTRSSTSWSTTRDPPPRTGSARDPEGDHRTPDDASGQAEGL